MSGEIGKHHKNQREKSGIIFLYWDKKILVL